MRQQPGQADAPPDRYVPRPEDYAGDNNPYRGIEDHGVPSPGDAPDMPEYDDDTLTEDPPVPVTVDPIPVRVVNTNTREMKRWSVTSFTLNEARAHQVVGQDLRRTSLLVLNKGPNTIYLSPNPNVATFTSIGVDVNDSFTIESQDDVWGTVAAGESATIIVSSEYVVKL